MLVAADLANRRDTVGYSVGRRTGRRLLLRHGLLATHRRGAVLGADRFCLLRADTVFARFLSGVLTGAVMAGPSRMRQHR
jgi:hypothetical protein